MRKLTRAKPCAKQSCPSLITAQPGAPEVTPLKSPRGARSSVPARRRTNRQQSLPRALCPVPGDVSPPPPPPHHCAVPAPGARCRGVERQCQVRGELPGPVQRGAVRRHAALRAHGPGRLRLLPGVRGRQRGALLPHRVGHARREVRTGIILRVLQGRGRVRGRVRDLQRYSPAPHVCCCVFNE